MQNSKILQQRLAGIYGYDEARAIVRLLLEECFELSFTDICLGGLDSLSDEQKERLETMICRLEKHEPVQYVIGHEWFYGRMFNVAPGVLIPRPETELLVTEALYAYKCLDANDIACNTRLLDIGTGSGCIAISMALELEHEDVAVEAWDISDDALHIAKGNANALGAEVEFSKVDILATTDTANDDNTEAKYAVIVSNPPYICNSEAADMDENVLGHEPHLALFVPDEDPLLFYRAIAKFGRRNIIGNGALLFEINRAYGKETCEMLRSMGYKDIQLINDQFDNPRIVRCRR